MKTRIARESSDQYALNAYRHIAQVSIDNVSNLSHLFVFSDSLLDTEDFVFSEKCDFFLQPQEGSLGDKMIASISKVRSLGYQNVGIMGVDCPLITEHILNDGFKRLLDYEISLGPSEDGGFYFLACKDTVDLGQLFENVQWSTVKVCHQIHENAAALKHRIFSCTRLYDIDFKSDYERFLNS